MDPRSYSEMDDQFRVADFHDSENTSLDLEFRQILCIIKHYIPYVDSNANLSLYRSWLEKLSSSHSNKSERNKYLLELARQIKSNNISPPFHQRPPTGPLLSFSDNLSSTVFESTKKDMKSCNQNWQVTQQMEEIPQPIASQTQENSCLVNNGTKNDYQSYYDFEQGVSNTFPDSANLMNNNIFYQLYHTRQKICQTSKDQTKPVLDTNINEQKLISINNFSKIEDVKTTTEKDILHKPHDDSSWCDLTDVSATSLSGNPMGSGDAEKVIPVQECNQNGVKVDPKFENNYKKFVPTNEINEMGNYKPAEPTELRFPLKDTNYMSADWKKTIEGLQMRLTETLSQNIELKAIIDNLKGNMKYETTHKQQIELEQKRSLESHKKEIETLKITHEANIRQLEEAYEYKIENITENYELKLKEVKAEYEMRMRELKLQGEYDKKEKDKEIYRLSEIIQQQCNRMSNEIVALRQQIEATFSNTAPEDKVYVLQKCVSKMDKLFHKSEKEYLKQIEKLKQELELKDKVTQIQLKTQKAQLIARNSVEKQKQLDEVVNNLEVKYIKMLEHHEKQVMESRLEDEEKIEYFRELLQNNDIVYHGIRY
ncbi:uncharacterized protein [Leptinotarsa decemlineata]|uniref:uncharacterized protein n=1 Tax=Leptinotarsa decemlineata TaxID=7539 RepID=UPI003D30D4CC